MDASDELRRDLLLASAFLHAPPPRDRVYANCFRVIRHALVAADLWDDRFSEAFLGDEECRSRFPVVAAWYSTLIELTRHEPQSERLLNGAGDLLTPSGAYFTACWVTPAGVAVAELLLSEHPEWKSRLTGGVEGV